MIQLGRRHGAGPAALAGIAEAEDLPLPYLEQLVARLRKAGLVASTRGAHGGYELTRAPADISMADVVSALEGSMVPMQCFTEPGTKPRVLCNHEIDGYEHCATKLLWTRVQGSVARALEQTTLAELVEFSERSVDKPVAHPAPTVRRARGGRKAAARV
jgi:Rrf2 family protein